MISRPRKGSVVHEEIFVRYDIKDLVTFQIKFYLTGSWSFNTCKKTSDLDLYTANEVSTARLLDSLGFKEVLICKDYGGDPVLKRLFVRENIHIQLVEPIQLKHHVQSLFEELPIELKQWAFGRNQGKLGKRNIWQISLHMMGCTLPDDKEALTGNVNSNPHTCGLCGSSGVDLAVTFYCTNPSCKNYKG